MYYEDIFRALSEHKVRYLVVGAMAMNLHGVPRMTADLDVMIDLTPKNLSLFVDALENIGYKPRAPIGIKEMIDPAKRKLWAKEKNMVVLTLFNPRVPYQELDVFINNPVDFKAAYKDKVVLDASGQLIPAASVADLIKMKELAGRKQDKSDIPALKKLKKLGKP